MTDGGVTDRGLWPEGLLQWAGRASLFNPLQSLGKMRVLRGLQFFSVFCRRCQLSVLVTALWLSPTPSIPGGSVDERGCPASHSGSPPPARHSCRLWAARPLVHCRVWPSGPLPCWGWRMPQPRCRCRLCPCVQSLLPSGAAGPARPPVGRLDAWTRLQPEAVARPLKGAPPARSSVSPWPCLHILPPADVTRSSSPATVLWACAGLMW